MKSKIVTFPLILATLLATLGSLPAHAAPPVLADRIVAIVNDDAITINELKARIDTAERQLRGQNIPLPVQSVLEKQVLERMIVDRIQLQMAKESAIHVDDSQLDAYLRRIADSNKMSMTDFRQNLTQDGITWNKFRDDIRDEMTLARLREREVDNRINISDAEVNNPNSPARNN